MNKLIKRLENMFEDLNQQMSTIESQMAEDFFNESVETHGLEKTLQDIMEADEMLEVDLHTFILNSDYYDVITSNYINEDVIYDIQTNIFDQLYDFAVEKEDSNG